MSTPSERLEAEIWLETTSPDLLASQRNAFFVAVDEYYDQYPTADRGTHFLDALRDDVLAFTSILDALVSEGGEGTISSAAEGIDWPDERQP